MPVPLLLTVGCRKVELYFEPPGEPVPRPDGGCLIDLPIFRNVATGGPETPRHMLVRFMHAKAFRTLDDIACAFPDHPPVSAEGGCADFSFILELPDASHQLCTSAGPTPLDRARFTFRLHYAPPKH